MEQKARRARIGVRTVEALEPTPDKPTRVRLWDDKLRGFGVRVSPNGRKTYIVRYKWRGKSQTYTIGVHASPWTPEAARARASAVLSQAERGEDPNVEKKERRTALTVSDLIGLWLRDGPISRPTKKQWSWITDKSRLTKHAEPLIGRMIAKEVRRRDIEFMQAEVARGVTADLDRRKGKGRVKATGGPLVAANTVQCVSAMYGWAIDQELVEHNPCLRVKRAKHNKRVRFLSADETQRLVATLDAMEAADQINRAHLTILRLLLLTGARKMEISNLKWSEIDWERACIFLPIERSKTGARDPIRLATSALEILKRWKESTTGDDPKVFPGQIKGRGGSTAVDNTWKVVRVRAKLVDFRMHDLRHNAASVAVSEGVSLYVAGKLLGHRNASTTERYAHVAGDPIHKAAEAVASRILNVAKGRGAAAPVRSLPKPILTVSLSPGSSLSYHTVIRSEDER